MARSAGTKRPLSFYVTLLVALVSSLIALVVLTGGIDLKIGPLRLQIQDLARPALVLLALLVLRRAILAAKKGGPRWQDAFFGPPGSATERWRAVEVLLAVTAAYVLFAGGAAVARHRSFGSEAMALGLAVQAAWNTLHGSFLTSSLLDGGSYLGRHFSPILAPIAQLCRFWEAPELLIRVQSLFLALAAWPVYLIAKEKLEDRRWAVALALLYVAHPAVRGMDLAGFHPATLAVAPFLMAFHLLSRRRRWGGYFFLFFALACGEEIWLAAALLGLYISFAQRRWREGLFLFLLTFYGFVFLLTFVMPKFGGEEGLFLARFSHLGGSLKEIVGAVLFHPVRTGLLLQDPARLPYLRDLFLPLAFLPLLGPWPLIFGLPLLALNLLSIDPACYSVHSAHSAAFLPFLFAAAAFGLGRLKKGWGVNKLKLLSGPFVRWALLILPIFTFGISPALYFQDELPEGYREGFVKASARVPVDASLSASDRFVPHLAQRETIHLFPKGEGDDYVLVELAGDGGGVPRGELRERVLALIAEQGYGVLYRDEFFLLLAAEDGERGPAVIESLRTTL